VEIGVVGVRPTVRSLDSRQLMADELVVVVAPDHPWAGRAGITVEDIRHEPLILRERGSGSRDTLERALGSIGLDFGAFHIVGEMGSTQAIKQAIRAGFGISLISRRAVEDECRARLLGCVPVRDLDLSRAFHLVIHRDRSRSPLAQAFLAFIESQSTDRPS